MPWSVWFLGLAVTCGAIGVEIAMISVSVIEYLLSALLFTSSCLFFHIWSQHPAANLSLGGIAHNYIELNVIGAVGKLLLIRFKAICRNVESAQTKILLHFLRTGKNTIYGRDHNLSDITSPADFRSRMRLTTYENYKPYIDRCLAGEQNIFFKEEVNYFAATSGTTSGKSKLYPLNTTQNLLWLMPSFIVTMTSFIDVVPKRRRLNFYPAVWTPGKRLKTDNGVEMGSLSTKMLRYQHNNCTPRIGYSINNEHAGQYVHMLFALREPEVGVFTALTSSVVLVLFSMVEKNWERFVRDIRLGEINRELDIPDEIRQSLNKDISPWPERADELEAIFKSGCRGMIPKIWPQLAGISTICTGVFALQAKVVQEKYVGPDIPMFAYVHMSTEGAYGMILYDEGLRDPETGNVRDDYVLMPNKNFYEFIPAGDTDKEQPETVLAHQVEIGKDYEMVVTTRRGLYRFRTGDLIRVVGFCGNTPRYRVLQRVGYVLNVQLEKLPEVVFREAVERVSDKWKSGKLVNYAATENVHVDRLTDTTSDKLFYVIFVATDSDQPLLEEEKALIDTELYRVSDTYRAYRNKGTISPPRVIQVAHNSFQELKTLASERNPLLYRHQYKHPRIIRSPEGLSILINNQL